MASCVVLKHSIIRMYFELLYEPHHSLLHVEGWILRVT